MRSATSDERCSTQISGRNTKKKSRTGPETTRAAASECCSAMPFGTSSPITTWRYVISRKAIRNASTPARKGSKTRARTGSPMAPMARLVSVTPSCMAAMKRGGLAVMVSTARARLLPCCSSSVIRVRRAVTRAYSAATKNAFSARSSATASSSKKRLTPRSPGRVY